MIQTESSPEMGKSAHFLNHFRGLFGEAFASLIQQLKRRAKFFERWLSRVLAVRPNCAEVNLEQLQTRKDWIAVDNAILFLPLKDAVAQREFE